MNTEERFQRIDSLFRGALRLEPVARKRFLNEQCRNDSTLLADVVALLEEDGAAHGALDQPALGDGFDLRDLTDERADQAQLPERIGKYRIIALLGAGGMGAVYEAEQDEPRRRVALKVIRAGIVSRTMLRRFRHEAQMLGLLTHPGIAQIHEAGTADDGEGGTPFFAMELVHGEPLLAHAERLDLNVRERLKLIARVADAVHHAHSRGVIHRDLKPANILVDQTGQPKILDFGVARATEGDLQTVTLQTAAGQLVGTVAYMSPEQAAGDAAALDTRSDVYALGVIMYELLSGQPPYPVHGRLIHEALRTIRDDEPMRLSSVNRAYRGDVETIVARALEKDPQRRYQSAAELSGDIGRHLRDEAIVARPATTLYQIRKFVKRNRALTGGAAIALAALVIGTIVSIWQAREALRAKDLADRQSIAAIAHAARATVASATVALDHGDPLTARRMLEGVESHLRHWEWRYAASRLDNSIALIEASEPILAATFSADGQRVWTITVNGAIEQWDPCMTSSLTSVGVGETLRAAAFSGGGTLVAGIFGENGDIIALWDAATGRELGRIGPVDDELLSIAITFDGKRVAGGGRKQTLIWSCTPAAVGDAATPTIVVPGTRNVNTIAFSKDGSRVVAGFNTRDGYSQDGWLAVLDAVSGERLKPNFRYTMFPVLGVDLDGPGRRVATGHSDKKLCVHDLETDTLVRAFAGHQKGIRAVALDPAGRLLAAASDDATVRVWDVDSGESRAVFTGHEGGATRVAFSADGERLLAVIGRSARVWSLAPDASLNVLRGHGSYVYDIAFLDDQRILSGAWDRTLRVWNTRTRAEAAQWQPQGRIAYAIAHAPQAGLIATAHDSRVSLWDATTYAHRRNLDATAALRTTSVSLSADGSRVAARTVAEVIVWETASGREIGRWPAPVSQDLCKVAISPDGRTVAADGAAGAIYLWEIDDGGAEPRKLIAPRQVVCALAFNRDGTLLASGSRNSDTIVRLWDVRSGKEIQRFVGHVDNVYALAFSPDETRLASGSNDTTVRLWDIASGEQVAQFDGHNDYVYSLAFSPDGSMLASGSGDMTVRIWDTVYLHERWRERRNTTSAP